MKAQFALKNPDDLEATLTITATVGQFRLMKRQVEVAPHTWHGPIDVLIGTLRKLVAESDHRFETSKDQPAE